MTTYVRTVHTTMSPADTVSAAEKIAEALRADGRSVSVGAVYDDLTMRWYGMPAIDITVSEEDAAPPPTSRVPTLEDDTPEPMPLAEFGGSAPPPTGRGPRSTVHGLRGR